MKRTLQHVLPLVSLALLLPAVSARAQEDSPPTSASEEEERIQFDFKLDEERGGGRASLSAGDLEYKEGQYVIATGGVDFKYRGLRLQARVARIDIPTNLLTAEGDVILDEGPRRLVGQTIEYDLDTRTGKVTEATAYVENEYYFTGSVITKTGEETFTVDDGVLTSCSQDVPSWSVHMKSASITLEEYARIKNARLKFKKVPVLYSPYLLFPANTERSSGFLIPRPGSSDRRGAELSLAYFKTLGRSADTTFVFDLSSEEYFGLGNETRYRPSERTDGTFRLYFLDEPDDAEVFNDFFEPRQPGDDRWKVELLHETRDLWGGFRGVVSFREYSDLDYLQDFERDADRQRQAYVYSNAYLSRNLGPHSLNILVDQRERILGGGSEDLRRQLPEVEYRLRKLRLGRSQIYLDLQSSLHYFSLDLASPFGTDPETGEPRTVRLSEEYGRADLAPSLSIPLSSLPWLSAEVQVGGRATYYTDSLTPLANLEPGEPRGFSGDTLDRTFGEAGLKVIGPSFLRIYDKKLGRFSKLKHIVEPRMTYSFVGDFENQNDIFRFDEIDNLTPVNGWLFSITNRFVAKPADPDQGGAVEVASLEVAQGLSLDDDQPGQRSLVDPTVKTSAGPLGLSFRVNPSQATSVRLDAGFSTLFDSIDLQSFRLSGSTRIGRHHFGLSWFSNWRVDFDPMDLGSEAPRVLRTQTSEQARVSTRLALLPEKLAFEAELSFDVLGRLNAAGQRDAWDLLQQRYFLSWTSQCYNWQIEFRESVYRNIEDRDVRFSLTLKNVGTFLDLNDSF